MMIDYRYPVENWGAVTSLGNFAMDMQEIAMLAGLPVKRYEGSHFLGYDVRLDFGDVASIQISHVTGGYKIDVRLFKEGDELDKFIRIWKNLINAGYIVDERFPRDLTDLISASVEKDNEKKASKYSQVEKRHEYIWRIIKPVVEKGGTLDEMRDSIRAKKQLGKNKDEHISVPNNATLKIIVEKYSKKQADTE